MRFFKKSYLPFLLIFILGAWVRGLDLWRPVDGTIRESWRECDIAAVARNFAREGMNILYPRIDWRGNGPGYAEMEFPVFSWSIALFYKAFGYQEVFGRLLSYIFSLLTLLIFFRLARYLLSPFAAWSASAFAALSPVVIRVSNALQPEAFMLLLYTLAAYAFIRWLDEEGWVWYGTALAATAAAILAKINAAHIGFFFLFLLLNRKSVKKLKDIKIWIFGLLSLLPAALWYFHAHRLWLTYGNSLGFSNEHHWAGWDIFTNPRFIVSLARNELVYIWMPLGGLVGLWALLIGWKKRTVKIVFFWLLAILIYYLVTIRTSADNWATYYHVVTIPPAALLFGEGMDYLRQRWESHKFFYAALAAGFALSFGLILIKLFGLIQPDFAKTKILSLLFSAGIVLVFAGLLKAKKWRPSSGKISTSWEAAFIHFLLFCALSTFLFQGYRISIDLKPHRLDNLYRCAQLFKPLISEGALIVASGGYLKDESGYPVAINASYMFYWLDRKGFNIAREEQSLAKVQDLVEQGARYFVLEKEAAVIAPGFAERMRSEYLLLKECESAFLFKLMKN